MLVLAIITYAMPVMTGRNLSETKSSIFAFWTSNIGMTAMTIAFGTDGWRAVIGDGYTMANLDRVAQALLKLGTPTAEDWSQVLQRLEALEKSTPTSPPPQRAEKQPAARRTKAAR